jgi:peptidoglycan/LPS O-acetylase OafA/YrhL
LQVIVVALAPRLLATLSDGANPRDLSYGSVIGRIDQFCIGMIAARLYVGRNLATLSPVWFLPAAIIAVLVLWEFNRIGGWPLINDWKIVWPTVEGCMWAIFIVTYIAAGRLLPNWLSWTSAKIGEISYSMYLIHFAVLYAIIKNGFYARPTGNGYYDALATTFLVALPIVIVIAVLTYHTIELPFLRMRSKYITRPTMPDLSAGV